MPLFPLNFPQLYSPFSVLHGNNLVPGAILLYHLTLVSNELRGYEKDDREQCRPLIGQRSYHYQAIPALYLKYTTRHSVATGTLTSSQYWIIYWIIYPTVSCLPQQPVSFLPSVFSQRKETAIRHKSKTQSDESSDVASVSCDVTLTCRYTEEGTHAAEKKEPDT